MTKKIAVLQSNYIPWKGYFDIIRTVDEFILYDCVQYSKNDWRNRNLIKTAAGIKWLTIPVHGHINKKIQDIEVANTYWAKKHWKSLLYNYSRAPFFKKYSPPFYATYLECQHLKHLSQINYKFIKTICDILKIKTKISWSSDYANELKHPGKTERLLALCKSTGATCYLSGQSARNYLEEKLFNLEGIELKYVDYKNYTSYPQLFGSFAHGVSILDLIFNTGPNTIDYMNLLIEEKL